jgi:hypothetical protein
VGSCRTVSFDLVDLDRRTRCVEEQLENELETACQVTISWATIVQWCGRGRSNVQVEDLSG